MSVAVQLGVADGGEELLAAAGRSWTEWVADAAPLGAVSGPTDLRRWLQDADQGDADRVLLELARLGSTTGRDDVTAARLLAWCLVPGACALARRLASLSPRIDEVVAAQLWIEVRAFPWQRLRKVAANVLANTRAGVLRDFGVLSQVERSDRTWSRTQVTDPHSTAWESAGVRSVRASDLGEWPSSSGSGSAVELLELLDGALEARVISDADRALLLSLVVAADAVDTRRCGRGHGGLMSNDVSEKVASEFGVSAITVRRRARRSMQALTVACAEGRLVA